MAKCWPGVVVQQGKLCSEAGCDVIVKLVVVVVVEVVVELSFVVKAGNVR